MADVFMDAVIDTLKLIPFLFITYIIMEFLERATSAPAREVIRKAGRLGPVWGSFLGAVPQCGFSAAASFFYVGKIITLGTLMAVYLSTSDEMLPIFLSEGVAMGTILKIIGCKIVIGMISGFLIDLLFGWLARRRPMPAKVEEYQEGCGCAADLILNAVRKTLQVSFFIFVISLLIGTAIELVGHQAITGLFHGYPVIGEMIAALIGLIPNCAASVIITQLYLEGIIGAGPMISGLLSSAGVGLLVLVRENRHWKRTLVLIGLLYVVACIWGILITAFGTTF